MDFNPTDALENITLPRMLEFTNEARKICYEFNFLVQV